MQSVYFGTLMTSSRYQETADMCKENSQNQVKRHEKKAILVTMCEDKVAQEESREEG